MSISVGVAPGTWGISAADAPGQPSWQVFLDEAAEAGYAGIEAGPYGYLPTEPAILRSELESRGLRIIATTVMHGHLDDPEDWPVIEAEALRVGELGAAMGSRHLVLIDDFYTDAPSGLDDDGWKHLVDGTHRVAELAQERFGLPIAFHSHAGTHVETEEQLENFLRDTDPGLVSLCFDTGHHALGGGDIVRFLGDHSDRISYLHFKNLDAQVFERVRAENIGFKAAARMRVHCDLDAGIIDYLEVSAALKAAVYDGWVMVENEIADHSPGAALTSAKRARAHLSEVGIG